MVLLKSVQHICLPAHREALIPVRLTARTMRGFDKQNRIIETHVAANLSGILVAKDLVEKLTTTKLMCRVFNPGERPSKITKSFYRSYIKHSDSENKLRK